VNIVDVFKIPYTANGSSSENNSHWHNAGLVLKVQALGYREKPKI